MRILSILFRLVVPTPRREIPKRPKRWRQPSAAEAFSLPALERAFLRVKANGGGPGGDGVSVKAYDRIRAQSLAALSAALTTGVYRPSASRRMRIARRRGGERWLAVPAVADRVAQTAWLWALAPVFEARMHPTSYGYRAGLGVEDAVQAARMHVAAGRNILARIDIEGFFDNVPHGRLFAELRGWVSDQRLLEHRPALMNRL